MQVTTTNLLDPDVVLQRMGIANGWRVADLGCGSLGHFVFPLARLVGATGKIYAIDVQRMAIGAIEKAVRREQCWHVQPLWWNVEHVASCPVPGASLDACLAANVLHQVKSLHIWAKMVWHLTHPGGMFVIVDWHGQKPVSFGPTAEERLDVEELKSILGEVGWVLRDDYAAGEHHHTWTFEHPNVTETQPNVEFVSSATVC